MAKEHIVMQRRGGRNRKPRPKFKFRFKHHRPFVNRESHDRDYEESDLQRFKRLRAYKKHNPSIVVFYTKALKSSIKAVKGYISTYDLPNCKHVKGRGRRKYFQRKVDKLKGPHRFKLRRELIRSLSRQNVSMDFLLSLAHKLSYFKVNKQEIRQFMRANKGKQLDNLIAKLRYHLNNNVHLRRLKSNLSTRSKDSLKYSWFQNIRPYRIRDIRRSLALQRAIASIKRRYFRRALLRLKRKNLRRYYNEHFIERLKNKALEKIRKYNIARRSRRLIAEDALKPYIYVILVQSKNNFMITCINSLGKTLNYVNAGICKAKGPTKSFPHTAYECGKEMGNFLFENNFKEIKLIIKSKYRRKLKEAVRGMTEGRTLKIIRMLRRIPIPHNGVRGKKLRRK